MKRILSAAFAALAVLSPVRAGDAAKWTEKDVSIDGGSAPLQGSLISEAAGGDAVLFLSGSGPSDRDGNDPGLLNNCLKMVADALADQGIGSLRVDKRGVAASYPAGMRVEDLTFEGYVADTKAWLAFLKAQPGVKRIFIIGHSEGALIGAMAAQGFPVDGYVSLEGASLKAGIAIRRQIHDGGGDAAVALAEPIIAKLEKGEVEPDVPVALMSLFYPPVQPYLITYFRYDPVVEYQKITSTRTLIIQGGHDLQVIEDDGKRLAAARPDAAYALIPDMNHMLRVAPMDRGGNFATYGRADLPLAPGVMEALLGFLKAP